jgi:GNAT superfamily N-acetyltransferase
MDSSLRWNDTKLLPNTLFNSHLYYKLISDILLTHCFRFTGQNENMISDQKSALNTVKKVLTADFACDERDFDEEGVIIRQAREIEGARRFPLPEKFLAVVSMGTGVVICCSAGRRRWTKANLGQLARDRIFDISTIARVQNYVSRDHQEIRLELKFICTSETFRPYAPGKDIELNPIEGEHLQRFYKNNLFPNALGYADNPERPHMVAVVASCGGETAGVAAATADCDLMWQIGVDTLPAYRQRGIAKATVSALTEILLSKAILPYYSTRAVNIASQRTALSLGYFPAWVELYSRELKTEGGN